MKVLLWEIVMVHAFMAMYGAIKLGGFVHSPKFSYTVDGTETVMSRSEKAAIGAALGVAIVPGVLTFAVLWPVAMLLDQTGHAYTKATSLNTQRQMEQLF